MDHQSIGLGLDREKGKVKTVAFNA